MEPKKLRNKKRKKENMDDDRFKTVLTDPRFDALPRKERKVVVDERFKHMLKSEKFASKSNVDMRGRHISLRPKNDLSALYELQSDSEKSDVEEEKEIKIDLARGNGNITSSDEDSSEWELDEPQEEIHCWGETDRDACRVEWASRRLALCNMEWDRISATDIYVLIASFKPPAPAAIRSVTIYRSDFGEKRLEEEERVGPRLTKLKKPIEEDMGETDEETREAMRAYQLERMRYYYAVIECDGVETASALYEACDGVEFESSSVRLDLRFVPDDMTFEGNMVKERVTEEDINLNSFKPKNFESAALSKSSARLTWDETDPERIKAERDAFLPDADLDQLQHLLAPCSSDEENDGEKSLTLLKEAEVEASKKADSLLEVTWDVGMMDDTASNNKKKKCNEPTPWEKYLEKRKAKRKERKAVIAELKKKQKAEMAETIGENVAKASAKTKLKKDVKGDNSDYIDDERFEALYSNSAFAIDQSHPLYKSSKLALRQAGEKQKRRAINADEDSIETLANKLKRKTENVKKKN